MPLSMLRSFKERYSYVGEKEPGVRVKVPVEGKPRKIEIAKQVGESCNRLLGEVLESLKAVVAKASPQSVFGFASKYCSNGWWKPNQRN